MNMYEAYESYIKTEDAEGIMLPYDDGRLAFIALKPGSGDARGYAASLTGAKLKEAIAAAKADTFVTVNMPKFEHRLLGIPDRRPQGHGHDRRLRPRPCRPYRRRQGR